MVESERMGQPGFFLVELLVPAAGQLGMGQMAVQDHRLELRRY
jgi:hypothetical protein